LLFGLAVAAFALERFLFLETRTTEGLRMKREEPAFRRQRLGARGSGSIANRFRGCRSRIVFQKAIVGKIPSARSRRICHSSLHQILEISSNLFTRPSAARPSFAAPCRIFLEEVMSTRTSL
jgi:hypothetical protein